MHLPLTALTVQNETFYETANYIVFRLCATFLLLNSLVVMSEDNVCIGLIFILAVLSLLRLYLINCSCITCRLCWKSQ